LRAKLASSGTSRPKLAGVDNTASGFLDAGKRLTEVLFDSASVAELTREVLVRVDS
jgi:hypothetical protein